MTALRELTTMRVGGTPASLKVCGTREDLIASTDELWRSGEDWLILSGGSNLVAADDLSALNVIAVATKGIERMGKGPRGGELFRVQAGENWDAFVATTVSLGLAGIEAMSGIPGLVGAAPVQNIGAYGQELSDSLVAIEFFDYAEHEVVVLQAANLGLGYRTSAIKAGRTGLVTWVELELFDRDGLSSPLTAGQVAADLDVELGAQVPIIDVRNSVLKLRASKGMVLNPADPDSVSCGSFFTNPIVSDRFARTLPSDAPRWETEADEGRTVKLSAAWLIEHAGIGKGFALPGSHAAVSGKHTLAITNRGGATAQEVRELAEFIQARVSNQFGLILVPEPNFVGF